jgi:dolichol-phosphate mannosyltransferase
LETQQTYTVSSPVVLLVPTRNETANIAEFLERVGRTVGTDTTPVTVVLVDDSDDDTLALARAHCPPTIDLHAFFRPPDDRVGTISGALLFGLRHIAADVVVVIDADLQHPPEVLPKLIAPLVDDAADVTVGTRYVPGGSASGLTTRWRRLASRWAGLAIHILFPRTRAVTDPASGLFGYRTETVAGIALRPVGFKMLTEILVRSRGTRVVEVPYRFQARVGGLSNFSAIDGVDFIRHLLRLRRSVGLRRLPQLTVRRTRADEVAASPTGHGA